MQPPNRRTIEEAKRKEKKRKHEEGALKRREEARKKKEGMREEARKKRKEQMRESRNVAGSQLPSMPAQPWWRQEGARPYRRGAQPRELNVKQQARRMALEYQKPRKCAIPHSETLKEVAV